MTKRLRSASTTPRSEGALTHCVQVMEVTSADSRESVRFGEESDPETEDIPDGVVISYPPETSYEALGQTLAEDSASTHDPPPRKHLPST